MFTEQKQERFTVVQVIRLEIFMKNLNNIFIKAKLKKVFVDINEFKEVLKKISSSDSNLSLDWDEGAGEEWAMVFNKKLGKACMLNSKIGVAFIRRRYLSSKSLRVLKKIYLVDVDDYGTEEWYIDLDILKNETPEIVWCASPNEVNINKLSLDDLYVVTV